MSLLSAKLQNGLTIKYLSENKIGEGGDKEFFDTENKNIVIGLFKDQKGEHDPQRVKRLAKIINDFNPTNDPEIGEYWKKYFCWPVAIVIEPRLGILSPKLPPIYYFNDKNAKVVKKAKWFLSQSLVNKFKKNERGNWFNRLKICRQLSRTIGRMHMAGLAHSDLSSNNFIMDPQTSSCILIDIDSLVVPGIIPPKVLGTPGYMAPEIVTTSHLPLEHPMKKLPNIKTDLHSLAVMIYETLLLRHPLVGKKSYSNDVEKDELLMFGENALFIENPYDTSNKLNNLKISYQSLGPHLVPLFERAFIEALHDSNKRPTAYEWEDALNRTIDLLYPCQEETCWHKWFVYQKGIDAKCPFCGWRIPDKVPIMHLFRKYINGQYLSEKHYLPLYKNKKLYEWHIRSDVTCPLSLSMKFERKGAFLFENDSWFLKNDNNEEMICFTSNKIKPGDLMEIKNGTLILLNLHTKGKLAIFQI